VFKVLPIVNMAVPCCNYSMSGRKSKRSQIIIIIVSIMAYHLKYVGSRLAYVHMVSCSDVDDYRAL